MALQVQSHAEHRVPWKEQITSRESLYSITTLIYKVLKLNCRLVYRAKPSHRKPYAHILRDPARTWKRWLYELRDFLPSNLDHTTPNAATLTSSELKLTSLCPKRVVHG